jgi:hypothetical protein
MIAENNEFGGRWTAAELILYDTRYFLELSDYLSCKE